VRRGPRASPRRGVRGELGPELRGPVGRTRGNSRHLGVRGAGGWYRDGGHSRAEETGDLARPADTSLAAALASRPLPPSNFLCRKAVTVAKSKKFRDQHGKVLLEGQRLVRDALEAGAVLQTLFFSSVGHLKELPEAELKRASLVKVKFEDIKSWSDLITPQGLVGKWPWK